MDKKKIFKRLAISAGVLSLLTVLLVGNVINVAATRSKLEREKEAKAAVLEAEKITKDLAIKTFDINTNKYQPVFWDDLEEESTSVTPDIKIKATAADVTFGMERILKIGDKIPVLFVGENEVLIAIKHANGTMSLIKYDVSKQKPIKTDQIVKEVKE